MLTAAIDIIKPSRLGEPEAGRGQRAADPRVVLMSQGRGSRGREAAVTPLRSRIRVAGRDEGARKPNGDARIPCLWDTDQKNLGGQQTSGSGQRATCNPTILSVERSHGGEK